MLDGRSVLHVGPFTKDKRLFSTDCEADKIRIAFEYAGYEGGKAIKRKPRDGATLYAIITGRKSPSGFGHCIESPDNRSFWRNGTRCTLEVASWPEWKQSYTIDGKRSEPITPERLAECRAELAFYDECDFATRQPCTENLQYRPVIVDGRLARPTCNGGMGCTTCWERYERQYEIMSRDWCD